MEHFLRPTASPRMPFSMCCSYICFFLFPLLHVQICKKKERKKKVTGSFFHPHATVTTGLQPFLLVFKSVSQIFFFFFVSEGEKRHLAYLSLKQYKSLSHYTG